MNENIIEKENEVYNFQARYKPGKSVVYFALRKGDEPVQAEVVAVKFTYDKVTYDLAVRVEETEKGYEYTRIYNVDSAFIIG